MLPLFSTALSFSFPFSSLDIKRDPSGRTNIPGLTRLPIRNINDVSSLMHKAAPESIDSGYEHE